MRCVSSTHFFAAPADVFPVSTLIDIAPLGRHICCVVAIFNAIIVFVRLGRLICCANSIHFFVVRAPEFQHSFSLRGSNTSLFVAPSGRHNLQCNVNTCLFSAPSLSPQPVRSFNTCFFRPPSPLLPPWSPQPMRCFNTCFAAPDI